MAEGRRLKKADAPQIVDELLPAQNWSKLLGVKLGLPDHEVEAITFPILLPRCS